MRNKLMSLAIFLPLISGHAMAVAAAAPQLNANGQSDNSSSYATLNFTGQVTSSLCQINTSDLNKTISLGDITTAQLKNGSGRGPSHTFSIGLSNCAPNLSNITITIRDGNGNGNNNEYLTPKSDNTSAKGVGVFITNPGGGTPITIGNSNNITVAKDGANALSEQTISLDAYIGTTTKTADSNNSVLAGTVDATGVITIKAV